MYLINMPIFDENNCHNEIEFIAAFCNMDDIFIRKLLLYLKPRLTESEYGLLVEIRLYCAAFNGRYAYTWNQFKRVAWPCHWNAFREKRLAYKKLVEANQFEAIALIFITVLKGMLAYD